MKSVLGDVPFYPPFISLNDVIIKAARRPLFCSTELWRHAVHQKLTREGQNVIYLLIVL